MPRRGSVGQHIELGPVDLARLPQPLLLCPSVCPSLTSPPPPALTRLHFCLIIWAKQVAMIFDPSTSDHLKSWLTKSLEPMSVLPPPAYTSPVRSRNLISLLFRCDADPSALADYILALLKHNGPEPELRKELTAQLDEFLEKGASLAIPSSHFLIISLRCTEGPPFIDALFTTLRTKSYLPYNSPPPPAASSLPADNGIPIPLDAIIPSSSSNTPDRSRKRPSDYADDIRPPKGPRVSQDGSFSRHGPSRGPGWSNGNWGNGGPGRAGYGGGSDEVNGAIGNHMNGRGPQAQYHPPDQRRGICRDYYSENAPFPTLTTY